MLKLCNSIKCQKLFSQIFGGNVLSPDLSLPSVTNKKAECLFAHRVQIMLELKFMEISSHTSWKNIFGEIIVPCQKEGNEY